MKKKKKVQRSKYRRARFIVLIGLVMVIIFIVQLFNDPHVQFRIRNILYPVSGEFIFYSYVDNIKQIYHADFNTAWDTVEVTQLTDDNTKKIYRPLYSPDGQHVAYLTVSPSWEQYGLTYRNVNLMVMDTNSQTSQSVCEAAVNHAEPTRIIWLSPDLILIQILSGIPNRTPFYKYGIVNIQTGEVIPFYKDNRSIEYPTTTTDMTCESLPILSKQSDMQIADDLLPLSFVEREHPFQILAFKGYIVASNDGSHAAKSTIAYDTRRQTTGIYISKSENQWEFIKEVHANDISWSPDNQYLIYDALHPIYGSVIAITSVDGEYTYPLLEDDDLNYFSPSWRP